MTISVTLQYFFRDKKRVKLLQLYWMKIWHVNSSVKFIHSLQVMYENWAVSSLPVKSSLIHIWIQEPDQKAKENFPVVLMRPSLKLFFERLKINSVPCSIEFILAKKLFFCILHLLRVYYELPKWPAPSWLDSSVGRALHRYRRGHGFESRSGLNFFRLKFFRLKFLNCLSWVYNCDDQTYLQKLFNQNAEKRS